MERPLLREKDVIESMQTHTIMGPMEKIIIRRQLDEDRVMN